MKTLFLWAGAGLVMFGVPASAAETPRPTGQDQRIRDVVYSETQVFRIVGVLH